MMANATKQFRTLFTAVLTLAGATVAIWQAYAQGPQRPPEPAFTAAQADQGKALYARSCASCHGENLDDGEFAPPLTGAAFNQNWGGKSTDALFTYISTRMPPASPGSLGEQGYAQVLAHMLREGGAQPGDKPLPADLAALKPMILPGAVPTPGAGPSGGLSPGVSIPPSPARPNLLEKLTPVTDAMLANPPAGEWLTWRRSIDGHGYSPLKEINKSNVANLRPAWTWSLPNGPNESTPLVHDGVLFVHGFGDKVQALDAVTGDLLWQYTRPLPKDVTPSVKRAIALYGDKVLIGTSDVHVVALNAKTGAVVWDRRIADDKDFRLTGGVTVAKGKVIAGTVGRAPGGNYIVALDVETGKEAWRFATIARPGEPGGNSWNGLPLEKRNGASVWVPGAYDPTLNLVYFGVAQTYDTGPLRNLVNEPGITNDGLYTDSTVAFNPDTGKLVWYFQHQPNDQWDLDWAFDQQIIKMNVAGTLKPVVVTAGKQAIFEGVEAETGKYVFSKDLGMQNVVTAIDPKTGAKTIDLTKVPGDGEAKMVCPHAGGSKSWLPSAYNATTKVIYTTLVESCMDLLPVQGGRGSLSTGVRWVLRPRPDSDGNYGRVEAFNVETGKVLWVTRNRAPQSTGALATAGGLVFTGSIDRFIRAYDDTTGKILWEQRLNDVPSSNAITYMINGKQYLAVVVGNGGAQALTFPALVPEIKNSPERNSTLWVFELPGKTQVSRASR
jgi:alcohol dehydrogenase (cytochrome c)